MLRRTYDGTTRDQRPTPGQLLPTPYGTTFITTSDGEEGDIANHYTVTTMLPPRQTRYERSTAAPSEGSTNHGELHREPQAEHDLQDLD